ncbi:hypothetical protein [Micavibrio aeruginosavorus]|uniref:hypothetical protein n=1 Tax=Micavibrio aeruginosavorus TaxID=349221 RepID=UPI003F4A9BA9
MKSRSKNSFFMALLVCSLLMIGWVVFRSVTIISNPVNTPRTDEMTTATLLDIAEKNLPEREHEIPDNMELLKISDHHLDLSWFYAYLGDNEKAQSHFDQIKFSSDKDTLLSPFVMMMLRAGNTGDTAQIMNIFSQSKNIYDTVNKIAYIKKEDEDGIVILSQLYINETLCLYAARMLLKNNQFSEVDQLILQPSCNESMINIANYKLAALAAARHYDDFFKTAKIGLMIEPNKKNRLQYIAQIMHDESVKNTQGTILSPYTLAALLKEYKNHQDDNTTFLMAQILQDAGQNDASVALARNTQDTKLKRNALVGAYNNYYRAGDREKTLKLATEFDLLNNNPDKRNSALHRNMTYLLDEFNDLYKNPTPLAYELAMMVKDQGTRFNVISNIYMSRNKTSDIKFPSCDKEEKYCVLHEMQKIASDTQKNTDRDYMMKIIKNVKNNPLPLHQNPKKVEENPAKCLDTYPREILGLSTTRDVEKMAKCHYRSGHYETYMASDHFKSLPEIAPSIRRLKNAYFGGIAWEMNRDKKTENSYVVASMISDPLVRREIVLHLWNNNTSSFQRGATDADKKYSEYEETRALALSTIMATSALQSDQDLLDSIFRSNIYSYWRQYDTRPYITAQQEAVWTKPIFDTYTAILNAHTHTLNKKCSPKSFRDFHRECDVRRMAALGQYQEAINAAGIENKGEAARIILFEKFMKDDLFRQSISVRGAFPYLSTKMLSHSSIEE